MFIMAPLPDTRCGKKRGRGLSACGGVPPVCWSDHQSDVGNRDEKSSAAGFEAFSVRDKGAFSNILKEFFF